MYIQKGFILVLVWPISVKFLFPSWLKLNNKMKTWIFPLGWFKDFSTAVWVLVFIVIELYLFICHSCIIYYQRLNWAWSLSDLRYVVYADLAWQGELQEPYTSSVLFAKLTSIYMWFELSWVLVIISLELMTFIL